MSESKGRRRRPLDAALFAELARHVDAPDMTGAILSRLGLGAAGRRLRRRRRTLRVAGSAALLLAAGIGAHWLYGRLAGGAPPGPTMPAAIQHDLDRHGQAIDRAIRTIRDLSRPRPANVAPPEDHNASRGAESLEAQGAHVPVGWV